ncbi:hypothetical protein AVEN_147829-1 [Araneus ventricosus]|uniref:Tc1-like transposase DDE domain-containing protein n=1 Tax=Araneus ventricosus TaxID=182803 RepID=A0A4Y2CSV2_ARAVE|nr:hypothetical protein AVEN_147829-1 [Araneus ventricosus]
MHLPVKSGFQNFLLFLKDCKADDVFNSDETGLFFQCSPTKAAAFKGDECHGGKQHGTAHQVDKFLESDDIRWVEWPARSLDFSPIEHIWNTLERTIATRLCPPRTSKKSR